MTTELFSVWRQVHHVHWRWLSAVVASWGALTLFAAVTIPLEYPYEARGSVMNDGTVIGLLIPLAVMTVAIDEGPADLVGAAAISLWRPRAALLIALLGGQVCAAGLVSWLADLPSGLVVTDTVLLSALMIVGAALLGVGTSWLPATAVAFVMTAPGVVPWRFNALYHRDVAPGFVLLSLAAVVLAAAVHLRYGATGIPFRLRAITLRRGSESRT